MGEGGRNRFADETKGGIPGGGVPGGIEAGGLPARRILKTGPRGSIRLPADLRKKLGYSAGARLEAVERNGRLTIRPNIHSLSRLYIEPTSRCNLTCRTCIRNTWNEPLGDLSWPLFRKLAESLPSFPHLESVMFAGFGEPTVHPRILDMIRSVTRLGLRAEMTTNGTRLEPAFIDGLIRAGLDRLWVSFDGAEETAFESIRRGAAFGRLVDALRELQARNARSRRRVRIGISFVVMRRNIEDLKNLDELARTIGADQVLVSNVLPYSAEMEKEMLCALALSTDTFAFSAAKTELHLPRLDITRTTRDTVIRLLQGYENLTLMGNPIFAETRSCRFVEGRTTFVRWDGRVAPCMGLLHAHTTFLYGLERRISPHTLGDIRETPLPRIWASAAYRDFREKVGNFDFSPCHMCGGCDLLTGNKEDCLGSPAPACGGCLWAQGVVQCP
jgi:MoaA/NifB/PqqE/SkfB family radical SAM enzyme